MSWLDELKVGDEVIHSRGGYRRVLKVTKRTKFHIQVDGEIGKFRVKNGRHATASGALLEAKPEDVAELVAEETLFNLRQRLFQLTPSQSMDLTTYQLRRIVAVLDEQPKEQQ